jgi:3'-phosphoadenosine 5'-phosphosulfate sulfotransferase (PAPS reductase)/FAD synthetase
MGPFKLTEPTCLAFSGGRTSAYLLWRILESNTRDEVMEYLHPVFCNTGKEEEASLRFVKECGERWNVPIVWLEWSDNERGYVTVDYETASRKGEPFEAMLRTMGYLPNGVSRFCTVNLKIRPTAKYLKDIGFEGTQTELENSSWVGFRADEPTRVAKLADKSRAPLARAGVTAADVGRFWKSQPFDLGLPNMNGKTMHGNCDLCFQKPLAQKVSLIAQKPSRAVWWVRMEKEIPDPEKATASGSVFSLDHPTYERMAKFVASQTDAFPMDPEEEAKACFCGD